MKITKQVNFDMAGKKVTEGIREERVCTGWMIGWQMLAEVTESSNDKTLNLQHLI